MKVRFRETGNEGDVTDTTYLPATQVGDLHGTWYRVRWITEPGETWIHADSVETIHDPRDLSFSGPEEGYNV